MAYLGRGLLGNAFLIFECYFYCTSDFFLQTDARKRCLRLFGESLGNCIASEDFQKEAKDAQVSIG